MKTIQHGKQSGSSLIVVLSVLATLMVVVAVAAEYTSTINRHVQRSNTEQSALAVADSCIEVLFSNWRKLSSDPATVTTARTTDDFDGTAIPLPTYHAVESSEQHDFPKGNEREIRNIDESRSKFHDFQLQAGWHQRPVEGARVNQRDT